MLTLGLRQRGTGEAQHSQQDYDSGEHGSRPRAVADHSQPGCWKGQLPRRSADAVCEGCLHEEVEKMGPELSRQASRHLSHAHGVSVAFIRSQSLQGFATYLCAQQVAPENRPVCCCTEQLP